jgi:cobalt-zinc-cadmium efflux system membrane fusion protein
MKRFLNLARVAALTLPPALGLMQCGRQASREKESEAPAARETSRVNISDAALKQAGIQVEAVGTRLISDSVQTTGAVGPDQDSIARIRPLARGRIEKVFVGLGDYVQAGSPLAEYDNIELGSTAGEYRNQWSELRRELSLENVAERSFARAQELIKLQAVSQREYEVREAELESARSAVGSRQATLAALEDKLHRFGMEQTDVERLRQPDPSGFNGHFSHTTLRSPVEGIIVKREVVVGEAVDFERELFTIVDISHVWVQANVAEKDLSKIRIGNAVKVRSSAYPQELFQGRIAYISDMLDPNTRVIKVRCVIPNRSRKLKLEMFVDVEIDAMSNRRALMVPHSALLGDRETFYVFVEQKHGEFAKRIVKVAAEHTEFTEVLEGLKEGERMVTKGAFYLKSESQRESIGEK